MDSLAFRSLNYLKRLDRNDFMAEARVERRLAAILAADVAGYSRLMGVDEQGTHNALKACESELIYPKVAEHRGRIVKTTGDGFLAEFPSVIEAVSCAVEFQRSIRERNRGVLSDKQIEFRAGINIGDIIEDGGDIFGDGVNVAARLESIADRGGICISRQVLDQIEGKLQLGMRELGRQNLKNISKPIEVYAIALDEDAAFLSSRVLEAANLKQNIRYCTAADGVRLAYATVGSGPPLVRTAHWMGHLEYDWEFPIFRHLLLGLAKDFTVVRYDARGNELSDWDVGEISLDAWVSDLEIIVNAIGLDKFPLLGFSQGCAIAVAFAARYPERVSHLVLYGGYVTGRMKRPGLTDADRERNSALTTLMKLGWGSDEPTFRQIFTSILMPTATKQQADAFNELERLSASPECAVRYFETVGNFDVRSLLPKVQAPTLVLHIRDDASNPIEQGRELAAGIPNARFVTMPGRNHVLLEQDPGVPIFFDEVRSFLHGPS
jgi:class 3 adenylate cyclase/pimeloyl-ACP methyl ester carboxylesterase